MLSALLAVLLGAGPGPTTVAVRLSEWKVVLAQTTVPAGSVTFTVTNAGSIPHAIEVEGRGVEKEIPVIQPGATGSLTLTLAPGDYEVYCPVGEDSHKKLSPRSFAAVAKFCVADAARSERVLGADKFVSWSLQKNE